MNPSDWRGVWTPLVTPFHEDSSLDWPSFDKHVAKQLDAKIPVVVLASSIGEGSTLSAHEKLALVRRASARVRSGEKLKTSTFILGAAEATHTTAAAELCKLYQDAGAHGVMVTFPLAAPFVERGALSHFKVIASGLSIPVFIYFQSSLDLRHLSPSFLDDLMSLPGILGACVKESSETLDSWFQRHPKVIFVREESHIPNDFNLSANPNFSAVFSPLANVFPHDIHEIWNDLLGPPGSIQTSFEDNAFLKNSSGSLFEFIQKLESYPKSSAIKACLHHKKELSPYLRLPGDLLSEKPLERLMLELKNISLSRAEV
jgi:dihydrodipicolinate synthase/N-acetylneuraminate lyase